MSVALINEVLRDFDRYSGDGKPNAPVGHPLPVGDPRSGVHNPAKYQLRELLLAILQAMGDPEALQDIIEDIRNGRVWQTTNSSVAEWNPPDGTDAVLHTGGGGIRVYRSVGSATEGSETDSKGNFWLKLFDSIAEAERLDQKTAGIREEFRSGRVYTQAGGVTPSGLNIPIDYSIDLLIMTHNASNTETEWRPIAAPANGLETGYLVKDANNRWWRRMLGGVFQNAIQNAGVVTLENVVNLDGAITATWPQWAVDGDMSALGPATTIAAQITGAVNFGPVSLSINGGPAHPVVDDSGAALTGGEIGLNHFYMMKWYPGPQHFRVFVGIDAAAGLNSRVSNLETGFQNSGIITFAPTSPIVDGAITADWPQWAVDMGANVITADTILVLQIPGATNVDGDITFSVSDSDPVPVRDENGQPLDRDMLGLNRSYVFKYYPFPAAWRVIVGLESWRQLEDAALLADGSSRLAGAEGYRDQDVMRLTKQGVRMNLDPYTGDDAFRKGAAELGPLRVDGGRDLLAYGSGGDYKGAFARIYPDRVEIPGLAVQDPDKQEQATFYGPYAADTFEEINGLKLPSRMVNGKPREAEIHSTYGQSNGDQATTNEAALWNSTSPWAYHTMMPNDATANENRGGMIGWGGTVAPGFSSLVYADVSEMGDRQFYGDASIQALNFLRPGPKPLSVYRSSAWGGNKLVGANPGQGIWKDSDGVYTQAWLNWGQDIAQMYASATALGYPVKRLFINFTHQEEDWLTPRATYLQQANDFKADIEAYIATIDPALEVLWFVDQASGSGLRSPKYMGNAWPARMAIVDFANQHDNVTMVLPRYWMKFGYVGDPAVLENIHHDKRSKVWQGEMNAHAKNEVIAGRAWKCPQDVAAVIDGNDVVIEFDTMGPLQLDWTFCKVRPDGGFQLWNPASGFNYDMTTFTDNAEWDLGVGSVTYVGSVTTVSNNQGGNISPVTRNKVYRISGDIQRLSGTTARVRIQIRWLSSENPDTVISVTSGDYITLADTTVNVLINEGMPPAGANFFDLMLTVDGANTDGQVEFSNVVIEATPTPAENVRVIAHNKVACTFPAAPVAGQFIRYAYRTQDMADVSDVWPIGTGAIRDDWEAMSILDPGKKLIRAALGFERAL